MIKNMEIRNITPKPGWFIPLIGHEFDLAYWEQQFKPPFEPWCERVVVREKLSCILRSGHFESTQTAVAVRELAIPLVAQLNGIMDSVSGAEPLSFHDVGRIDDSGRVQIASFATGTCNARAMTTAILTATGPDGKLKPPPPPEPSVAQKWLQAAQASDEIADMLVFAGRADNWFDLYKAIEVAERIVGGEKQMPGFLNVSKTKYGKLRQTANFHRHAPEKDRRYTGLLTLSEAQSFLAIIIRAVLAKSAA